MAIASLSGLPVLLQPPESRDVRHRQGEYHGLGLGLHPRLGDDRFHNGLSVCLLGQDKDNLLLRRQGHAEEFPGQLRSRALGVDGGASGQHVASDS